MKAILKFIKKWPWILCIAIGLLGLAIELIWQVSHSTEQQAAQSEYTTAVVQRGSLSTSIDGSGILETDKTIDISFPVSGTLEEVAVQVGDQVTVGQVLATLANQDALELDVQNKQLALQKAQKALDDLLNSADNNLAQALLDQASSQATYAEALWNLHHKGDSRCESETIDSYYAAYLDAKSAYDNWTGVRDGSNNTYGTSFTLDQVSLYDKEMNLAYENLIYCEGYTDQEILESEAALALAKAKMKKAEEDYQKYLADSGLLSVDVELAKAKVTNAELQLQKAQDVLDEATMVAPMAGTVMAVNGEAGDEVGTDVFITITDLENPILKVNVDETDLKDFVVGCSAEITFDSFSDRTFIGTISKIYPTLVEVNNVDVVQGIADIYDAMMMPGKTLTAGLAASVTVDCEQASDVLLIPYTALVETSDDSAYVYVLDQSGNPEKRDVEIGLNSTTYVEILSGVDEGETVITNPD